MANFTFSLSLALLAFLTFFFLVISDSVNSRLVDKCLCQVGVKIIPKQETTPKWRQLSTVVKRHPEAELISS